MEDTKSRFKSIISPTSKKWSPASSQDYDQQQHQLAKSTTTTTAIADNKVKKTNATLIKHTGELDRNNHHCPRLHDNDDATKHYDSSPSINEQHHHHQQHETMSGQLSPQDTYKHQQCRRTTTTSSSAPHEENHLSLACKNKQLTAVNNGKQTSNEQQQQTNNIKKKSSANRKSHHRNRSVEKYAYYNDGLQQDDEDNYKPSKSPTDDTIQEFNRYSLFETNDSSQVDHFKNKQRKENNNQAHPKYPNFTLKLSYEAVIFDKICYNIAKRRNIFIESMPTCFNRQREFTPILKSIDLNIPQGTIFGLLGPSSCGKTTLLRCLVGLLQPSSGSIRLFGHDIIHTNRNTTNRESKLCHVPGKNVGYMPQDLGLYEDFSIRQLLTTFGRYVFMPESLIEQRIEFMTKFLDLPDKERIVMTLSGGQKRRVSFAVACLHMPPLIILDEPTVGVDPLLRRAIWTFLRRLATNDNRTILITTHYIEEAARADQVALMRAGEIVMQDTPKNIMLSQSTTTLEEAFLKICNKKESDTNTNMLMPKSKSTNIQDKVKKYSFPTIRVCDPPPIFYSDKRLSLMPNPSIASLNDANDRITTTTNLTNSISPSSSTQVILEPEVDSECGCCLRGIHKRTHKLNPMMINSGSKEKSILEHNNRNMMTKTDQFKIRYRVKSESSSSYRPTIDQEITDNAGLQPPTGRSKLSSVLHEAGKQSILFKALIYKNYKRNFNSMPLVVFQFMLPIVQMITFCLCIGGKPTNVGLGVVNMDSPSSNYLVAVEGEEQIAPMSSIFLSYIDTSMLDLKPYPNLTHGINDVAEGKLWAVMELRSNFTDAVIQRFNLPDLLETDAATIDESLIRLYSDKTRRILDILCLRSLMESYKTFLNREFIGFEHLPVELGEPIFSIKPSIIGTSVDGYTESIAAGLMASLTYFMAAGLTTFIMVVERGQGILERTYTTGISPFTYLLAHAIFRSIVMMAQIAFLMCLTFLVLDQPLVGSALLTYTLLVMINCTGISFGLLISSLCQDQNGAALAVVSSLVLKLTLSGILWPLEAIPNWLKLISYIQPLTMPVAALRSITLKGRDLYDKNVSLGFLACFIWFVIFLAIASRRFKFYQ